LWLLVLREEISARSCAVRHLVDAAAWVASAVAIVGGAATTCSGAVRGRSRQIRPGVSLVSVTNASSPALHDSACRSTAAFSVAGHSDVRSSERMD
jgi:hypothetical protein